MNNKRLRPNATAVMTAAATAALAAADITVAAVTAGVLIIC